MRVKLTAGAIRDLQRLEIFLAEKSRSAAAAAVAAISASILSLAEFPERGLPVTPNRRQLVVRFGRDGYVVRYQVRREQVLISRIFHGRERR